MGLNSLRKTRRLHLPDIRSKLKMLQTTIIFTVLAPLLQKDKYNINNLLISLIDET